MIKTIKIMNNHFIASKSNVVIVSHHAQKVFELISGDVDIVATGEPLDQGQVCATLGDAEVDEVAKRVSGRSSAQHGDAGRGRRRTSGGSSRRVQQIWRGGARHYLPREAVGGR